LHKIRTATGTGTRSAMCLAGIYPGRQII
jgi:hypothetical protein